MTKLREQFEAERPLLSKEVNMTGTKPGFYFDPDTEREWLRYQVRFLEDLAAVASDLVREFHEYGPVLQKGEDDNYGEDSAVGALQTELETYGKKYGTPVEAL